MERYKGQYKGHEVLAISIIFLSLGVFVLFIIQQSSPDFMVGITGQAIGGPNDTVSVTLNITESQISSCDVNLVSGWNLVSFFCLHLGIPRDIALASIDGDYNAIFAYFPNAVTDPWKSYNPNLPDWTIQDLELMSRNQGYWIYMNSASRYNYSGIKALQNSIPLEPGWSLEGYPSGNTKNASDAFSSLNGSYNLVAIYDESSGSYLYYYPNDPASSDFNLTVPYEGYWINATDNDTWVLFW
ncbi:MAG: hypothetical protein ABIE94_01970 [archaeon]